MSDELVVRLPLARRKITETQREQLLKMVSDGMTRAAACRALQIPTGKVSAWLRDDPEFGVRWREARETQIAALEDECIEIADEPCKDLLAVTRNRLRVDTRFRVLARWAPRGGTTMTQIQGVVLLPSLDATKDAKQVAVAVQEAPEPKTDA